MLLVGFHGFSSHVYWVLGRFGALQVIVIPTELPHVLHEEYPLNDSG